MRVADALVDCALPLGVGPHSTLEALAVGTPILTLAPSRPPPAARPAAREGAAPPPPAVKASATVSPPSALLWRPAVEDALRVEHGFAANFLRALFCDNTSTTGSSNSSSSSSSFSSQGPSDAEVLAAMVVEMPAHSNGDHAAAASVALGAAWVSAAARLAEPGFRRAARRAVARRLEAWALRSPAAAASGLSEFVANAVAAQRAQQRKGLAAY
jgi:hypothetical protein